MLRLSIRFVLCSLALVSALPAQTPVPAAETAETDEKKTEPGKDKAFAEIVKDAQTIRGLFTIYRRDEKSYLEILPGQFDKTLIFSLTCESGLGERGFYAAQMCGETPFVFHKSGKIVQMIARNPIFTAKEGTPIRRAVDRSFVSSILGSARIESMPQPERKSVLVDLNSLLLSDIPMLGYELELRYRIQYRFDAKNSSLGKIKAYAGNVEIETLSNYMAEKPMVPPLLPVNAPPLPIPRPPATVADVRSMLFTFRYSISELPQTGYKPRIADDRVGHFFNQLEDYTTDSAHMPTRRFINRWQLEKEDPSAPLSRPKQPIVFWLENTIPVNYREAVREGVLMWNKAFERIGFKEALGVKQQPDDSEWDPADVRYNTIRWFINTDTGFAIGPSRSNPFTGQIYDADIGFSENFTRFMRRTIQEQLDPLSMPWESASQPPFIAPWSVNKENKFCTLGDGALREMDFAAEVLMSRGIAPDTPEAEEFVKAQLRQVTAHEVGHTLGLRHNFAASTIHTLEQNQDRDLTAKEGISGSVMDYIPANLAPKGLKQGEYYQAALGAYDYWAIEYAYKPIPAETPEQELSELRKIAERSSDPLLAYATDEDAGGFFSQPYEMDPMVNRYDLGTDPLRYATERVRMSREIVENMERKLQKPGEGYAIMRRSFGTAFGQSGSSLLTVAKYIGGIRQYRDHVGDPNGRLPMEAVPAATQKAALELLRKNVFALDAFAFSPQLLNKLATERHSDYFRPNATRGGSPFNVPVHAMVLSLQQAVLNRVLHPAVLSRVLDSEMIASRDAFRLSELFQGLQDSIWAELQNPGSGVSINSYRRSLQREHLKRMTNMVLRDAAVPEEARTLARYQLAELQARIHPILGKNGKNRLNLPLEVRAHLSECAARIDESLNAQVQRTAF
jgi:Met-zincin/Domain of unknown function (DUF5117)